MVKQQPSKKLEKHEEQKAKAAAARVQAKANPRARLRPPPKQRTVEKHVRGVTLVHPTVLRTAASPKLRHRKMKHHLLTGKMTGGSDFQVLIRS